MRYAFYALIIAAVMWLGINHRNSAVCPALPPGYELSYNGGVYLVIHNGQFYTDGMGAPLGSADSCNIKSLIHKELN